MTYLNLFTNATVSMSVLIILVWLIKKIIDWISSKIDIIPDNYNDNYSDEELNDYD